MSGSHLPVSYKGSTAVARARQEIDWVDERDLSSLEFKEPWAAGALSLFTGGGGQVYAGDHVRGLGLIAAAAGALALAAVLPGSVAALAYLAVGVPSSLSAWRKARAINRYLAARRDEYDQAQAHPPAYRLLAAMNQAGADPVPTPAAGTPMLPPAREPVHGPLAERLRKLLALAQSGVIDPTEHRGRKIDLLTEAASDLSRDDLDDLLFEMLPLRDQGVIDDEDLAFIKQLGGA